MVFMAFLLGTYCRLTTTTMQRPTSLSGKRLILVDGDAGVSPVGRFCEFAVEYVSGHWQNPAFFQCPPSASMGKRRSRPQAEVDALAGQCLLHRLKAGIQFLRGIGGSRPSHDG